MRRHVEFRPSGVTWKVIGGQSFLGICLSPLKAQPCNAVELWTDEKEKRAKEVGGMIKREGESVRHGHGVFGYIN